MDVKTAFPYRMINQLVYIQISKSLKTTVNKEIVCKLLKIFYDLNQIPKL